MEVEYFPQGGSITDYVCRMFDVTLGVSVTRAMHYGTAHLDEDSALRLLNKKLNGVIEATRNSLTSWSKQVLHIWAQDRHTANVITKCYDKVSAKVRADTVVIVTSAVRCPEIFSNG